MQVGQFTLFLSSTAQRHLLTETKKEEQEDEEEEQEQEGAKLC